MMQEKNIQEKADYIGEIYRQLKDKQSVKRLIATVFNKRINTINNHWLSRADGYSVPIPEQDKVIQYLEVSLNQQKLVKTK